MSRYVVGATWDDAPHLSEGRKKALWDSIPAYQRDARAKGVPQLGAGAIYPFPESGVRVPDFQIPKHFVRGFGFDCALAGTTAAVWGALDRETSVLYLYSIYKRAQADTAVHAESWKGRGIWIPGVGDAADVVDSDRTQFLTKYQRHGFNVSLPIKAVETGIQAVYDRLSQGKLKVFESCELWFSEFRVYKRDKHGKVVKTNDHLMDATRYLIMSGIQRMKIEPVEQEPEFRMYDGAGGRGWMSG